MSDQEISSDHETTTYYRNIDHHHHQHVFTIATLELEEEGVKQESDTIKQHKRMRSAQLHNHNERLRRQRLKEKMKTLQELIPNCRRKRDKSSTFDDAIKYIKTLQHQVQVLSAGAGYSTFNMMPQPEPVQQGMQFPPFLQTGPPSICVKHAIGMGMSTMLPSLGIPNPWFMPSSDASGLSAPGGISAATSFESRGSEPALMQGPISEQSSPRRESTATTRVLPTKIVHSKDVVDYGYGSTGEWFFFYPFQLI